MAGRQKAKEIKSRIRIRKRIRSKSTSRS